MISRCQSDFLNVARWVAAALVVIEHARNLLFVDYGSLQQPTLIHKAFYFLTGFGHEAVVIFFVISGFLVGGKALKLWQEDRFEWRRYLADRTSRLFAVLVAALVIGGALDLTGTNLFALTGMYDGKTTENIVVLPESVNARVTPQHFAGNLLMLQDITVETFGSNGPLWSLAHEWWYYLLFPLALFAWRGSPIVRFVSVVLLVGICALVTRYILILFGVWLIGVLCWIGNRRSMVPWPVGLAIFGAGLATMRLEIITIPLVPHFLLGAGFGLMLHGLSGGERVLPFARSSKFLADFSYSVYLVHFPVLLFGVAWLMQASSNLHRLDLTPKSFGVFVLMVVVAFLVSFCVSLITERKTNGLRQLIYRISGIQ